ncbi:sugar transporter [Parashewanella spongiae]|uniref:Sugar transporter n=1 Tax=Parashewanella spongiae TaxID=342950 RepID=A0A3A6TQG6_9GAMM|nr:SLBB domain-containing protein [Parashewanella spongiae]RJY18238.1 sugar transporter [Parashewanella spongiae]
MFQKAKQLVAFGLAVTALAGFHANAITPTPQMLEQFKNLPKSEQEKLAKQYGVDLGSFSGSNASTKLETPLLVKPREQGINSSDSCLNRDAYQKLNRYEKKKYDLRKKEDSTVKSGVEQVDSDTKLYCRTDISLPGLASVNEEKKERELKFFGYEMFASSPTTFAPVTDVPIPSNYMVGPGDILNIQLIGKESAEYSLTIGRDGNIQFPNLGPISLVGLNFEQVRNKLIGKVNETMIGVEANVSMGELRSIRIFITGDAYQPGSYTVSSLATITQALFVSGGLNEIGSLRNIQLKRAGKIAATLDLYDLLLKGDASGDRRLQAGDVVFIPSRGGHVSVSGEVLRPAMYEIKQGETVQQAINMASGFKPNAFTEGVNIQRFNRNGLTSVVSLDMTTISGKKLQLKNGDFIRVDQVSERVENAIEISGSAIRTGQYQWRKGMKVSDLLTSVRGSLKANADLDYSLISREINHRGDIEILQFSIGNAINDKQSKDNIELQPRDSIIIFEYADRAEQLEPILNKLSQQTRHGQPAKVVEINGNVRFPGYYPYAKSSRIKQLISAAGGMEEGSYTRAAELTRQVILPDTGVKVLHSQLNLNGVMENDSSQNIKLQSRDVLTVRTLPDWQETRWVTIKGEVHFPGTYSIQRGESMKDVIERAGGLTEDAFPFGAVFLRASVKEKEERELVQLADELRREIAAKALTKDGATIGFQEAQLMLDQLQNVEVLGRLSIDLPSIVTGQQSSDIVLEANDELLIPSRNQTVSVMGQVQYPSTHRFISGIEFDDYLAKAGGSRKRADEDRAYILRANGSVIFPESNWLESGTKMMPGDTIVVPLDTEYKDRLTLWQQVTSIIYNSAVAVASVARINN